MPLTQIFSCTKKILRKHSDRLKQKNETVQSEQQYDTPPGIKKTPRSNSAHALANSMYSTYSAGSSIAYQLNQASARNSLICQSSNRNQIPHQELCECHASTTPHTHTSSHNQYEELHSHASTPQTTLQTSLSSQSLPRRNVVGRPVASSTTTAPFPTANNTASASCIVAFDLNEPTVEGHRRQAQAENRETRADMFGSGCSSSNRVIHTSKASTPISNNPNYRYSFLSSQQPQAYPAAASSQPRKLNSSFIGAEAAEYRSHHLTSPSHQRYPPLPNHHPYDRPHTSQYSNPQSSSSSATETPPSSVENYGCTRIGVENVFNADYSSVAGTMSACPADCKNPIKRKNKSSNRLSSVFGTRHSKLLTPISNSNKDTHQNEAWSIDHQNYTADKSHHLTSPTSNNNNILPAAAAFESNSIVLYNSQNHQPTTIDHPSCSMSRSSSTQGFIGREYFEAPQLSYTAGNQLMMDRRTTNQELTEPIIVLAKQLGNKEVEINRLKSQLSRRSSRNESKLAQYEDELSYSRDQNVKLKTKLRLCEAECTALKTKKEELEKRLDTVTANYEQKLETMEKENATNRKEYSRLKQLEEAYEKYLDEKDWVEKNTDSLNQKLDENESSLHISEQECQHLRLELERLKDCLKDKEAEICELTAKASSESEEDEALLLTAIQQKCSLKEMKRRGKATSKHSTPKPNRPNVLLTSTSKSCSGLHLASSPGRSCSSTPDSVAAPGSVTSSGVSSFGGGKLGVEHNYCLSVTKNMQRCSRKLNECQRRVSSLLETTQRMIAGRKPTKNDILGSASESEADLFDYDQFTLGNTEEGGGSSLNDRAVEKALEAHCSQIAKLYQNIEALHGSLLAAYGRRQHQVQQAVDCNSQDPYSCRVH